MAAASVLERTQLRDREISDEEQDEKYNLFVLLDEGLLSTSNLDLLDLARTHSVQELINWLCLLEVIRERGYSCDEVIPSLEKVQNIRIKQAEYQNLHKDQLRKTHAAWMRNHRATLRGEDEKEFKKKHAEYMRHYRAKKKAVLGGTTTSQNKKSVSPGANEENDIKT